MVPEGEELLLYTEINNLPEPETFSVNNLLNWLKLKAYPIDGPGENSWGKVKARPRNPKPRLGRLVRSIFWEKESDKAHLDLVIPRKVKQVDGLTRWILREAVPFWEGFCVEWNNFWKPTRELPSPNPGSRPRRSLSTFGATLLQRLTDLRRNLSNASQESKDSEDAGEDELKIVTYRTKILVAFTTFVATVVASILPIVAIVVLSRIHKQDMILGFIALFTGLFTMGLLILTPSGTSRTEIFTASAT